MITWQFQSLVSQHGISSGKIDQLGIETTVWGVMPYMPLYLIQAMIGSISLTAVLGGLYARSALVCGRGRVAGAAALSDQVRRSAHRTSWRI